MNPEAHDPERAELEQKLASTTAALAAQQAKYEIGMARAEAAWAMVDEQLRVAALEVERARQNQAAAVAASEQATRRQRECELQAEDAIDRRRAAETELAHASETLSYLTRREAELDTQLAALTTSHQDLERRLAATEAAFDDATTRATRERFEASKRAADREAELDAEIRRERAARETIEQVHASTQSDLEQMRRERESLAGDVDRLTQRTGEITAQLGEVHATRQALELQLDEARTALREAASREAELHEWLEQERVTRTALEQTIADAGIALRDAELRHETALAAAAAAHAEREGDLDRARVTAIAERDALSQRVSDTEAALDRARQDHESAAGEVQRLTERSSEIGAQLIEVQASHRGLESRLDDAQRALQQAASRTDELENALAHERATRAALEQTLADAETALRDAERRHETAIAAAAAASAIREGDLDRARALAAAERDQLSHRVSETEAALDQARNDYESAASEVQRLTERSSEISAQLGEVQAARDAIESQLEGVRSELREAAAREAELQSHFDRERTAGAQAIAERDQLSQRLSDTEAALEQARREYASAAGDAQRLAERERDLVGQLADVEAARDTLDAKLIEASNAIEQEVAARQSVEQTLAHARTAALDTERTLRDDADVLRARTVEQRTQFDVQLAQERLEHETRVAELEAARTALTRECDALRTSIASLEQREAALQEEVQKMPGLLTQVEETRGDNERLFEHAAIAMFRCTRDGALIEANRACTTLVGRRTNDELHSVDFATAVFEAPHVLSWLIEQCVSSRVKESAETTWRRKDGARLFVRLSARATRPDVIEIVAEDLTRIRVLQERLGQAHRMEAVGRFASEVAITCGNLLEDIHQKGREWLVTAGCDGEARQHGDVLFDEVGRAAGFLQQLAECGDEQARTPMLVDLNTLVRDLEPVLKRVAGDDVEIQVRDSDASLNVDVGTERVERLLVNLASYGRERMPSGGRLKIELGTSMVDGAFAARHPNVRPGMHALITVTEIRRATATRSASSKPSQRPGVDMATLQELVSECGGHLWMKVQPLGDMIAKIHLPLLNPNDQPLARPVAVRSGRESLTARLFQS